MLQVAKYKKSRWWKNALKRSYMYKHKELTVTRKACLASVRRGYVSLWVDSRQIGEACVTGILPRIIKELSDEV